MSKFAPLISSFPIKALKSDIIVENNNKETKMKEKNAETLEAVYIYIYIVRFNEINLCKRSKETMYFRRT